MGGAEFSDYWMELKDSYRLPLRLIPVPRDYSESFLREVEVGLPTEPAQGNIDLGPVELRWIHLSPNRSVVNVCFEEVRRQMQYLHIDTAISDIAVLVP